MNQATSPASAAAPQKHRPYAGQLTIDLTALKANYKLCQRQVSEGEGGAGDGEDSTDRNSQAAIASACQVAAAVKADAYGIGMIEAAGALHEAGCRIFFVATLDEALALRGIFKDTDVTIAVLNGLQKDCEEIFDFHSLTPVLNALEQVESWAQYSKRTRPYLKSIIHFDTGMSRLGLDKTEQKILQGKWPELQNWIDLDYVMSHFACADEPDHPLTEQQFEDFQNATDSFIFTKKSIANSSGIFRDRRFHCDMVRPGMCLYGLNPTPDIANPMQPVVRLDVPVLQLRRVQKGESVGYGASWVAQEDTDIATIQLGYADGFLRSLSNSGAVYWQNIACPIIGRVSMDLTMISLAHIPAALRPKPNDRVEVIGPNRTPDDIAAEAGTIGYEILTSLGRRYQRVYVS